MKKFIASLAVSAMFLASTGAAFAAPWVPANAHPFTDKYVAVYGPGTTHAIAGYDGTFVGRDLVMARGNSGQFQQWFEGTDPNGNYVAIHSVWNLAHNASCSNGWVTIPNAYPDWGNYLVPGATYCVHNNFYQGTK
jgi:hypothetical protein